MPLHRLQHSEYAKYMHKICIKYLICRNMHLICINMHIICTKYAKKICKKVPLHRLQKSKYAIICKKNMQKICQYATKKCKKYAKNMQNMHKSKYLHILHIYALPTLLMLLLVRRARKQKIFASSSEGWGTSARCNAKI